MFAPWSPDACVAAGLTELLLFVVICWTDERRMVWGTLMPKLRRRAAASGLDAAARAICPLLAENGLRPLTAPPASFRAPMVSRIGLVMVRNIDSTRFTTQW